MDGYPLDSDSQKLEKSPYQQQMENWVEYLKNPFKITENFNHTLWNQILIVIVVALFIMLAVMLLNENKTTQIQSGGFADIPYASPLALESLNFF